MLNGGLGVRIFPQANRKKEINRESSLAQYRVQQDSSFNQLKLQTNSSKRNIISKPDTAGQQKAKTGFEILLSGGARQLYYRDNAMFPTGALTLLLYRHVSRQLRIGLALDAFYDGVFAGVNSATNALQNTSKFKRTYLTGNMLINRFRGGLSLQPELMFGKLTAGFHFGIYLFNPIKNLEPYNDAKTGSTPMK